MIDIYIFLIHTFTEDMENYSLGIVEKGVMVCACVCVSVCERERTSNND